MPDVQPKRCSWVNVDHQLMREYHDREWGVPTHDDRTHLEFLILEAAQAGRTVLVLEAAPKHFRGGNSRHTRNLRCMHDAPADVLSDTYPEDEYWQDLLKVTGGLTDEKLPVGLQLIAPRLREDLLLQVSHQYEQARPWNKDWPTI